MGLFGALVGIGGTLLGARSANKAAKKSAKAQVRAAEIAAEEQRAARDQAERLAQPFLESGRRAVTTLEDLLSGEASVDDALANNSLVRFTRDQGESAIARGLAARGLNQSGGALKDLVQFNADVSNAGAQQFVLDPLLQLAGGGRSAAANLSGLNQTTASNLGNLALGTGNARASSFQQRGRAGANAIESVVGLHEAGRLDPLLDLFRRRNRPFVGDISSGNVGSIA